jgi:hypothetical protein
MDLLLVRGHQPFQKMTSILLLRDHRASLYEAARLLGREGDEEAVTREIENAIWRGDIDMLGELAGCRCCCYDHTFEDCPARVWSGCYGQGNTPRADRESWQRHYMQHHGMTERQFYCWDDPFVEASF